MMGNLYSMYRDSWNFRVVIRHGIISALLLSTHCSLPFHMLTFNPIDMQGRVTVDGSNEPVQGAILEYHSGFEMIPGTLEKASILSQTDSSGNFKVSFIHNAGATYKGRGENLVRVSPPPSTPLSFFIIVRHPDYEDKRIEVEFQQILGIDGHPKKIDLGTIHLVRRVIPNGQTPSAE